MQRMTSAEFRQRQKPASTKPKRKPPRYYEALEQELFVAWARNQAVANPIKYPFLHLLHCSLNGVPMTKGQAGRAVGQGMLAGIPDLFLPYPCGKYHGLYIELKAKNGRLSPEQKQVLAHLASLGYKAVTCYGHQEAVEAIREYYGRG